ncbi:squalene/phytoene synthase family protein [Meridianimarinicoccus aquatilis]|uniref:Phytoene synthase n=1 Tax=Meridianimarinicoccus aquatilis TaxID=2552766 RepID=A0A4R6B5F6_9RHOB|nr:squalene/phytoene synthase family protein [Fluviibacterium aquatile]QIE41492.1 squalene/phytoene synthase family protein [Rhodobacteraceae bacterium SC52]TDL91358.1 phytoene synthase [Fluviibacterium aquatile]
MSLDACAGLVERGDPDRFRTLLAAPLEARKRLLPIYAFNVEVSRAPWLTEEAMIAEMRLQWWRDVLEEIINGGQVRRHEVATPLSDVIDAEGARRLDALVAAHRWSCYRDTFEDDAALIAHIAATGGGLMSVAARTLGAKDTQVAEDAGFAAGLAAWFLAVPDLEERGRRPLVDGRPQAVAALAQEGLTRLARARKAQGAVPKSAKPALWPAWRAKALLSRASAVPARVGDATLPEAEARKRWGLLVTGLTGRI